MTRSSMRAVLTAQLSCVSMRQRKPTNGGHEDAITWAFAERAKKRRALGGHVCSTCDRQSEHGPARTDTGGHPPTSVGLDR